MTESLDALQLGVIEREQERVPASLDERQRNGPGRAGPRVEEITALGDEPSDRLELELAYSTQQRCSREYRSRSAQWVLQPSSVQRVRQTSRSCGLRTSTVRHSSVGPVCTEA
ncbi:MAG TPA: hypothetical protein VIJ22_11510 [Polyangiaceae bacterium]